VTRLFFLAVVGALGAVQNQQPLQDFQNRVSEYQKLHDKARSQIPKLKPTASPEAIGKHERALAYRIREARGHAAQRNIFTPEISAEFKRLIGETMKGPEGVTIRQSLARSEPVRLRKLRVNQAYPEGVPLQTTPPSLLLNLPALPKGYEYRLVNNNLVLLDVEANLIVDFIPNAIP
jgi:hypothetical protein